MKPIITLVLCLIAYNFLNAQSLTYFEVNSRCIALANQNPFVDPDTLATQLAALPNNTPYNVSIITCINQPSANDSLYVTITNSEGQSVYASGNTITGWKSLGADRTEGSAVYLTIDTGPFTYLKRYTAVAILRPSGGNPETILNYNKTF